MPARWADLGLAGFAGCVRFRRRFGYPGQIDSHERVWLTCAGLADTADVSLNGVPLAENQDGSRPFEFEVTSLLGLRNEVQFDVTGRPDGGLWGEVALEVRCAAFLRNVRPVVHAGPGSPTLEVHGEVVGPADGPLELYAILNRFTVAYATVTPQPVGEPFALVGADVPAERWGGEEGGPATLQIDLVNGASVWYTWSRELSLEAPSAPGL
jgi:hypothetical protein